MPGPKAVIVAELRRGSRLDDRIGDQRGQFVQVERGLVRYDYSWPAERKPSSNHLLLWCRRKVTPQIDAGMRASECALQGVVAKQRIAEAILVGLAGRKVAGLVGRESEQPLSRSGRTRSIVSLITSMI